MQKKYSLWQKKWFEGTLFLHRYVGMIETDKSKAHFSIDAIRKDAFNIFKAGVVAADPYQAVKRCLSAGEHHLEILLDPNDKNKKRVGRWSAIHLIAFGKAACSMAQAAQEIIPESVISEQGIAVTNYENETPVDHFTVIGAGHPLPDDSGCRGAKQVAEIAQKAKKGELVLVLISGGGSALIPFPAESTSLEEKIETTRLLLGCGATINQVNCVRKHLSGLKGGGLARKSAPADLHALILSDVIGGDISSIASGPTVPDTTSFQEARDVLTEKGIWNEIPENIRAFMDKGCDGQIPDTPKPGDKVFQNNGYTLIGSNVLSVDAIVKSAQKLRYETRIYTNELCGEARDEAEKLVLYAKQLIDQGLKQPLALLAGGETTVTLKGTGKGGRNQEMALAFALSAERLRIPGCWVFLSGGTDGRDGPTDAAGGLVDPGTLNRMRAGGIDPQEKLDNNDSYNALKSSHDLMETGTTGTNVADLQILLLYPNN